MFLPFYAFQNEAPSGLFGCLKRVVLECERLGYDAVWLDDHLMYKDAPVLECWTTLSALACATSTIRLGTMVTSAGFRNPALLAKMAATVDVISNGRLNFGVGAGVQREEHVAYGFSFPEARVRVERLCEAVEVVKGLWSGGKLYYAGAHFSVAGAVCEPKPLQKPHPPITVGGGGEKYTLRVTARYADRFDFGYLPSVELYRRKLRVLERHCKKLGRAFEEIEASCWPAGQVLVAENPRALAEKVRLCKPAHVSLGEFEAYSLLCTVGECRRRLEAYVKLGVRRFVLFFGDLPGTSSLRLFAAAFADDMR
ncbi:MAG: TIGR03560 family F420-dependent LLM class oxidoreductase [Candidatus Bathyarchaeia archaeon]